MTVSFWVCVSATLRSSFVSANVFVSLVFATNRCGMSGCALSVSLDCSRSVCGCVLSDVSVCAESMTSLSCLLLLLLLFLVHACFPSSHRGL